MISEEQEKEKRAFHVEYDDFKKLLALLLEDLKANPMRYVHFSLFGQSEEKIAEKAAKRAEREAKRAARKAE